jgi:hypothetical protein
MIVFCPGCGTRISANPSPLENNPTVTCPKCKSQFATGGVNAKATVAEPKRKLKPKKKGNGAGLGILIGVFAIAVVGGGAWAAYYWGLFSRTSSSNSGGVVTKSSSTEWREYSSAEGKFKVMLPGVPIRKTRSSKEVEFGLETPDAKIGVVFADLPEKTKPEKYMVAPSGSKVLKEAEITQGDYKGRDIVAEVPNQGTVHMRFLTTGKRLYTVMIVGKSKPPAESEVSRVLDSFQITG